MLNKLKKHNRKQTYTKVQWQRAVNKDSRNMLDMPVWEAMIINIFITSLMTLLTTDAIYNHGFIVLISSYSIPIWFLWIMVLWLWSTTII